MTALTATRSGHERRLTAHHEAGHAVMAELCGEHVTAVEIVGDDDRSGSVRSLRFPPDPVDVVDPNLPTAHIERRLLCLLAGPVAEEMAGGRDDWAERGGVELDEAVRLALKVVHDCHRVLPYLEEARTHVETLLAQHWDAVERVAEALVERGSLGGDEVRRVLEARRSA
jgi:ATP-dependent Zn protease